MKQKFHCKRPKSSLAAVTVFSEEATTTLMHYKPFKVTVQVQVSLVIHSEKVIAH